MAKKKKKTRHRAKANTCSRVVEVELSEEFVEGQRDMFCALYCAFSKACEWWRDARLCRLQAFGKYDRNFEQMLLRQFTPDEAAPEEDLNTLTADDLQLHPWSPKFAGHTGNIVPLGKSPQALPARTKPNCVTEVLLAMVRVGMETGCKCEDFSIHYVQQEDGNWKVVASGAPQTDAYCVAGISSEEMNKLAAEAGIDLSSVSVEILGNFKEE